MTDHNCNHETLTPVQGLKNLGKCTECSRVVHINPQKYDIIRRRGVREEFTYIKPYYPVGKYPKVQQKPTHTDATGEKL